MIPIAPPGIDTDPVWVVPSLLALFGLGLGLWFAHGLGDDASSGDASRLHGQIRNVGLFLLVGEVPGGIHTWAVGPSGVYTMAAFVGGAGIGLILGYYLYARARPFAQTMAASLKAMRDKVKPTPPEVLAFATKFPKARKMLGLEQEDFESLLGIGAGEVRLDVLDNAQRMIVLSCLVGTPICQVSRETGRTLAFISDSLGKAL